ncbi:putative membrane protein [Flavobacterium arsenatis]|uniref:Membrane protein n=1 Tax=Flavobacterium arsenatis TaxID=1484332 RepID=A0ABU1TSM7_9FLAO|nr:putative membrane protein [Flavobacterium arsenatis]
MEKKIKRISIINYVFIIIIVVAGLIQLYFQGEYINYRRLRAVIGYFVIVPSVFISLLLTFSIFRYYYKNKFKKPLIYFFSAILGILLFIYLCVISIWIIIQVLL